jgi:hypothetical protein
MKTIYLKLWLVLIGLMMWTGTVSARTDAAGNYRNVITAGAKTDANCQTGQVGTGYTTADGIMSITGNDMWIGTGYNCGNFGTTTNNKGQYANYVSIRMRLADANVTQEQIDNINFCFGVNLEAGTNTTDCQTYANRVFTCDAPVALTTEWQWVTFNLTAQTMTDLANQPWIRIRIGGADGLIQISDAYYSQNNPAYECPLDCTTPEDKTLTATETTICPSGETTTISVVAPQDDVTYALFNGDTQVGENGTEWEVSTAATYTLKSVAANDFCEVEMGEITIVSSAPAAPSLDNANEMPFCRGDLSAALIFADGNSNVYWQTSATGTDTTNPVTSPFVKESASDDATTSFYLRTMVDGCWSEATEVTVTNVQTGQTCVDAPVVTIERNAKYFTDSATGAITSQATITDNAKWIETALGDGLYMYQNYGTKRYLYYDGSALGGGGDWFSSPATTTATAPSATVENGYKWGKLTNGAYIVLANNATAWTAGANGTIFLSGGGGGWTADVPVFGKNQNVDAVQNNVGTWLNGVNNAGTVQVCTGEGEPEPCDPLDLPAPLTSFTIKWTTTSTDTSTAQKPAGSIEQPSAANGGTGKIVFPNGYASDNLSGGCDETDFALTDPTYRVYLNGTELVKGTIESTGATNLAWVCGYDAPEGNVGTLEVREADGTTVVAAYSLSVGTGVSTNLNNPNATPATVEDCFNVLGQSIDCDSEGVVIERWSNGEVVKTFR